MKILHVFDHSLPVSSGYSLRSTAILREQRLRGWTTLQLTGPKHGTGTQLVEQVGEFEFHRTIDPQSWIGKIPMLNQLQVVWLLRKRLKRLMCEHNPDIVHAHSPCLNGLAALGLGKPVVYELRASWEDGAVVNGTTTEGSLRYKLSRALETIVLRKSNAIATICEGLKTEVLSRSIAASKITVIPNAVDAASFADIANAPAKKDFRAELGLQDCYVLGFLGSYFAWEGLSLLIEALPQIIKTSPNVRVLLVGGGQDEETLRRRTRELGVESYVIFKSRVPHNEVGDLYRIVDCLVYPRPPIRLTEMVTPLKPLEAMAMRKVVVASDVGGHRELIQDGVTGVLFKAGDANSLAATIVRVMRDKELQIKIATAGERYVQAERTWAHSVAAYEPVYRRLLNNDRDASAI